jgi:3',5'-cyclic AMP phosphodiesterase CpdA
VTEQQFQGTRRDFLMAAGLAACGLPGCASWTARGAADQTLRMVFFSDVHARTEWQTPVAMAQAAAAINARGPELIVAGGDVITDGFQSAAATVAPRWQAYREMHRALNGRVEPVLGNHDLVAADPDDGSPASPDPRAEFRAHFGLARTYRSFEASGYHFILLDSIVVSDDDLRYHGRIDDTQLAWLERDLATVEPEAPIVVATHIPLLTSFYQATDGATAAAPANRVVGNNREVLELFDGHNLLLVLQGHLHVDEMVRWRETTFITGGAVCGKWWRGAWHGTPEGFGVLTLRPDRVDWEYVTYGWVARRP